MTLTLEITASSEGSPADFPRHVFTEAGGTIGRASTNAWVLSHNKVSGHHAEITFRNGVFYIQDTSRNGVAVNSPENRLVRNRPYALKAGDRLLIEPYEINVWVDAEVGRPARHAVTDPYAHYGEADPFGARQEPDSLGSLADSQIGGEVDPLKFFDPVGDRAPARKPEPISSPADDLLGAHYEPPAVLSSPAPASPKPEAPAIPPQGYNPLADDPFGDLASPPRVPTRPASTPPAPFTPPPFAPPPPEPFTPPTPEPFKQSTPEPFIQSTPVPPSEPPAAPVDLDLPITRPEPVTPTPPPRPRPGVDGPSGRRKSKDASPEPAEPATVRQAPIPAFPVSPGAQPQEPAVAPLRSEPAAAVPPVPQAPKAPEAAPRAGGTADLAELLAGAGVPDAVVTPELSRHLGEILRIVVAGLMDVLQSRQRIKEEFRMHQTMFRPLDNNPLKFSANVEDALHNLLVKRNQAYLAPVEAFADAFDDLRDHQLAILAGMRVAFEAMLAEFDSDKLQADFDRQMGKASLVPAKLRYWDLYREKRREMAKDPDVTFARLFGDQFRRAYEEQFRDLKAKRRNRTPPPPSE